MRLIGLAYLRLLTSLLHLVAAIGSIGSDNVLTAVVTIDPPILWRRSAKKLIHECPRLAAELTRLSCAYVFCQCTIGYEKRRKRTKERAANG